MTSQDKYAVFGNPIKHSKSPAIHAAFASQCGQSMQYRAVRVETGDFERAASNFFAGGGKGLNITMPFKEDAFRFAGRLSERAQRAGAVNTLTLADDGVIEGDTTDGVGLVRDMVANLGWMVQGRQVLIIGAGGAVRGVLEPLLRERPGLLVIVNRTAARAEQLATVFSDLGPVEGGGYGIIGARQFDLVINASGAGLAGELPDLPSSVLTERSCCYDMVYGPEPTPFMRWAAHHAAWAVSDGLGMLVEQAAQSFYIWRGQRPETQSVIARIRQSMESA
ncbi:shikimate dehydrogenase [Pseudohalioglobus sediminis]|uniref:Shikimate dehydrogenase (NADP(+)) n=1 Tax=Pseudohalioglobus sediminis TaxID=2606449 RepID=A0A5B0WU14_9GAMM|nr:shikimate dehydrogenase [Pseudohalioglobus sediminis]KAA1190574.1 shikimate dehydrogenase [Pseudohalioglobus sediminis]